MLRNLYFSSSSVGSHAFSASSSSPRLHVCQISFLPCPHCWASPRRKIVSQSLSHSLTQLIWCVGNGSFHFVTVTASTSVTYHTNYIDIHNFGFWFDFHGQWFSSPQIQTERSVLLQVCVCFILFTTPFSQPHCQLISADGLCRWVLLMPSSWHGLHNCKISM